MNSTISLLSSTWLQQLVATAISNVHKCIHDCSKGLLHNATQGFRPKHSNTIVANANDAPLDQLGPVAPKCYAVVVTFLAHTYHSTPSDLGGSPWGLPLTHERLQCANRPRRPVKRLYEILVHPLQWNLTIKAPSQNAPLMRGKAQYRGTSL